MDHYAGIDVSLESSSLCVVDATGRVVREAKIASEPEALTTWLKNLGLEIVRIGLEAGPLSKWLYAGMQQAGWAAELLETRHVHTAFKIMPVVKTDREDARGIAQLMRLGWFRPVHLQVAGGAGNPCRFGGSETIADQAPRHRNERAGHAARVWAEGR